MRSISGIVIAVAIFTAALARAAGPATRAPAKAAAPNPAAMATPRESAVADPREVLGHWHHENLLEAEEARIALKAARDPQLHALAKTLIADHAAADRMLEEYAHSHDLDVPDLTGDAKAEEKMLAELRSLGGADFDRVFARHVYESHVKEIEELLDTRSHLEDQRLRNVLTRIKPKLDQHKNSARAILRRLEAPSAER